MRLRHWNVGKDNPRYGIIPSEETRMKIRLTKIGEHNPKWKGDNIKSYTALHAWIKRHLPKPDKCELCDDVPRDLANKTGIYNRDFKNWYWLCRRCHMITDGRMNNLKQFQVIRNSL